MDFFDRAVLYGDVAFSIIVLLTKRWYFNFLKKDFHFSEDLFQSQRIEIVQDFHFLNLGLFVRSLVPFFRGA